MADQSPPPSYEDATKDGPPMHYPTAPPPPGDFHHGPSVPQGTAPYPPSGYPQGPYPPYGQPAYPPSGQPAYPPSGQPAYPPSGQPAYPPSSYPPSSMPPGTHSGQYPQYTYNTLQAGPVPAGNYQYTTAQGGVNPATAGFQTTPLAYSRDERQCAQWGEKATIVFKVMCVVTVVVAVLWAIFFGFLY